MRREGQVECGDAQLPVAIDSQLPLSFVCTVRVADQHQGGGGTHRVRAHRV